MKHKNNITNATYVEQERKKYSIYVLEERAIPALTDGLRNAARRVLWMARDGGKFKSAELAGATMVLHPHAAPESTINSLAAPYQNNIPLLDGSGSFGTLLKPGAFGASRYTSVKLSQFTKDVLFVDKDIIPMVDNYDRTRKEPDHFLPLIPVGLVNSVEGLAVGFRCHLLSRNLNDIIDSQIKHLQGRKFSEPGVFIGPLNQHASDCILDKPKQPKWKFNGSFQRVNTTTLKITSLPYGSTYRNWIDNLDTMMLNNPDLKDYQDASAASINVTLKTSRSFTQQTDDQILDCLKLTDWVYEYPTWIDIDGTSVCILNFNETISKFTNWRLQFFVQRYTQLREKLDIQLQKYRDIVTAIDKNVSGKARAVGGRSELITFLETLGIVHVDYIADMSVYRFTIAEREKVQLLIDKGEAQLKLYDDLINDEGLRIKQYISELREIKKKYGNVLA